MPDWIDASFGDSSHEFYSNAGAWTLSEDGKLWVVVLKSSHRLTRFNLVEEEPPYRLYLTLGDPDSRHAMTFVKTKWGNSMTELKVRSYEQT